MGRKKSIDRGANFPGDLIRYVNRSPYGGFVFDYARLGGAAHSYLKVAADIFRRRSDTDAYMREIILLAVDDFEEIDRQWKAYVTDVIRPIERAA
ncbi:hypothetical protein [Bradyrhizobium sp. SRS-191]|uniref:hypothetical protein n=1 Tax=Bradyrhizobium sp. SRS-191 TaxID=2962606 RepID=UPI00211EC068|nr:hypothetical protein [Bradyrhizobium sp. SRS-191]